MKVKILPKETCIKKRPSMIKLTDAIFEKEWDVICHIPPDNTLPGFEVPGYYVIEGVYAIPSDCIDKVVNFPVLRTIVSSTIAYEDVRNIALSFEVPSEDFDLIEACKKAAVAYCKTEEGHKIFTEYNCHAFNWADFDLYVPNCIMEQFGFRKIEGVNADYTVDFDEQLVLDKDVSPSEDEVERIFEIELVSYDAENIPQHCSTLYIKSNLCLDTVSLHILKKIPEIYEAIKEEGAEGILSVSVISDAEFEEIQGEIEPILL